MSETITAYPLTWPQKFPRSPKREKGAFKTSLAGALKNVETSLRMFASDSSKKVEGLIISSNVTLGAQHPADPGVAVWFTWDGLQVCIPVDRYLSVESNLQAIHHIIEARRTELRHGTLALVRATFTGFKSLPAPASSWKTVLGFAGAAVTFDSVERRYKELAQKHHPDKGGDAARFAEITAAREEARREMGGA